MCLGCVSNKVRGTVFHFIYIWLRFCDFVIYIWYILWVGLSVLCFLYIFLLAVMCWPIVRLNGLLNRVSILMVYWIVFGPLVWRLSVCLVFVFVWWTIGGWSVCIFCTRIIYFSQFVLFLVFKCCISIWTIWFLTSWFLVYVLFLLLQYLHLLQLVVYIYFFCSFYVFVFVGYPFSVSNWCNVKYEINGFGNILDKPARGWRFWTICKTIQIKEHLYFLCKI